MARLRALVCMLGTLHVALCLKGAVSVLHVQRDHCDSSAPHSAVRTVTIGAHVAKAPPKTLVCISDTHGFEADLGKLPDGDMLVHAGDFAKDGNSKDALIAHALFDEWLASQPHPVKVVVRGNHDPKSARFPKSGALYFADFAERQFLGLRFAFAPYPVTSAPEPVAVHTL